MAETAPKTAWEARMARQEVTRLLQRIRSLTLELRSFPHRGGPDVDLKVRELERLRRRLALVARNTAASDAGAAA
jgi:hypothetical protein